SGLPATLPAPAAEQVMLQQGPLDPAAYKPLPPAAYIQPASAAPQIVPSVAPLPSAPLPLQPALNLPAELIRTEMPALQSELHALPKPVQSALATLRTLAQPPGTEHPTFV